MMEYENVNGLPEGRCSIRVDDLKVSGCGRTSDVSSTSEPARKICCQMEQIYISINLHALQT